MNPNEKDKTETEFDTETQQYTSNIEQLKEEENFQFQPNSKNLQKIDPLSNHSLPPVESNDQGQEAIKSSDTKNKPSVNDLIKKKSSIQDLEEHSQEINKPNKTKHIFNMEYVNETLSELMKDELKDKQAFISKLSESITNVIATSILLGTGIAKPYVWATRISSPFASIINPTISKYIKASTNCKAMLELAKGLLISTCAVSGFMQEYLSTPSEPALEQYWNDDNGFFTVANSFLGIEAVLSFYNAALGFTNNEKYSIKNEYVKIFETCFDITSGALNSAGFILMAKDNITMVPQNISKAIYSSFGALNAVICTSNVIRDSMPKLYNVAKNYFQSSKWNVWSSKNSISNDIELGLSETPAHVLEAHSQNLEAHSQNLKAHSQNLEAHSQENEPEEFSR